MTSGKETEIHYDATKEIGDEYGIEGDKCNTADIIKKIDDYWKKTLPKDEIKPPDKGDIRLIDVNSAIDNENLKFTWDDDSSELYGPAFCHARKRKIIFTFLTRGHIIHLLPFLLSHSVNVTFRSTGSCWPWTRVIVNI